MRTAPPKPHRLNPATLAACALMAAAASFAVAQDKPAPAAAPTAATAGKPAPAAKVDGAAAKAAAATLATPVTGKAAKAAPAAKATPSVPLDSIAVVVNDDVITRNELDAQVAMVETRMRAQKMPVPPAADLQRQVLERMIVNRAQLQLAREQGLRVDDPMLDRALARLAEQNKMSLQQFRDQLEREGTPLSKFREEIREEIVMQRLREREVDSKIQISDAEVDSFIAAEANAGKDMEEVNLAQILVRTPENASPEQIAARRERAEEVLRQVKSGGDFAKIAATYSDAAEALKGGELGWRGLDRVPQLFGEAIAGLKPGMVSGIVRSANGFHILKLVGKRNQGGEKAAAPVQQSRVRHILIKVNQLTTAAEARRKLSEIKERLDNKAATFEELAKSFSNDGSASKGGDLGWLYPGDTVPEFEQAVSALKPGEVGGPVETPFGFHLIEVLERKTEDVSKDRQRAAARNALRERKLEEAVEDWLRQVRDRAYVEMRLEQK